MICLHKWGFPRRDKDGRDWQCCTRCGQRRISPVQFGKRPEIRVELRPADVVALEQRHA